jgi:hypothetical protein
MFMVLRSRMHASGRTPSDPRVVTRANLKQERTAVSSAMRRPDVTDASPDDTKSTAANGATFRNRSSACSALRLSFCRRLSCRTTRKGAIQEVASALPAREGERFT